MALAVMPGPLTIPPVLVGLLIWSTEFTWARRFFESSKEKAKATWAHAKHHPVSSTRGHGRWPGRGHCSVWAVGHFHLVDRIKSALGL